MDWVIAQFYFFISDFFVWNHIVGNNYNSVYTNYKGINYTECIKYNGS